IAGVQLGSIRPEDGEDFVVPIAVPSDAESKFSVDRVINARGHGNGWQMLIDRGGVGEMRTVARAVNERRDLSRPCYRDRLATARWHSDIAGSGSGGKTEHRHPGAEGAQKKGGKDARIEEARV